MTTTTATPTAATTTRSRFARRFAAVAAVLVAAPVLGLAVSPAAANANAGVSFGPCGDERDSDVIWDGVKDATPSNKGSNRDVVWPNNGDKAQGWAVHEGHHPAVAADLLVVPTARETGIECSNLLDPDAPEYFKDAYSEIGLLPKGTDWVMAINSKDHRGQNQLHIHLTRLSSAARTDIDAGAQQYAQDEKLWVDSYVPVKGHSYRAWNVGTLNHNFFSKLNNDVVVPLQKQGNSVNMSNEVMLITANHTGPGFVVLSSDEKTNMKPYGVNNIEGLLDKS